jgi:putative hydrolase of the HAD superfamily
MTVISRADTWYLFDYGLVISTAPEPQDWHELHLATGLELCPPTSPYWANREAFDAGALSPADYWSGVLGSPVDAERIELLETLDARQWSHLNEQTISVLNLLGSEHAKLALLSNMPAPMAQRFIAASPWAKHFSKMFFSGQLGLTKPDQRIFDHVAAALETPPRNIVFIDDNAANIAAARKLGFKTILHSEDVDLLAELGNFTR